MSKKISQLTLKNSLASTDVIPILDSEDSYENKKVLASSISGGSNVHIIENTTLSYTGNTAYYSGTGSDVTAYEVGHIYIFRSPENTQDLSNNSTKYLNINSLGNIQLYYNYLSNYDKDNYYKSKYNSVFRSDSIILVTYDEFIPNSSYYGFFVLSTSANNLSADIYADHANLGNSSVINNYTSSTVYGNATIQQRLIENTNSSTVTINFNSNDDYRHSVHILKNPVTSLTITNVLGATSMWEKEIQFTTDSTFTMTATDLVGKWIGVNTTATFDPNTTYVVKIKNGYGYIYKVA